jgi:hypothetical protein
MNRAALFVLALTLPACLPGPQEETPAPEPQPGPAPVGETVTLRLDAHKEPCQVPFDDLCWRAELAPEQGFETLFDCVDGLEYQWGTRYTVEAQVIRVDNSQLMDARCDTIYRVRRVLDAEPLADAAFTLELGPDDIQQGFQGGDMLMGVVEVEFTPDARRLYEDAVWAGLTVEVRFEAHGYYVTAVGVERVLGGCDADGAALIEDAQCGCDDGGATLCEGGDLRCATPGGSLQSGC